MPSSWQTSLAPRFEKFPDDKEIHGNGDGVDNQPTITAFNL
jgi:hypothetical protein